MVDDGGLPVLGPKFWHSPEPRLITLACCRDRDKSSTRNSDLFGNYAVHLYKHDGRAFSSLQGESRGGAPWTEVVAPRQSARSSPTQRFPSPITVRRSEAAGEFVQHQQSIATSTWHFLGNSCLAPLLRRHGLVARAIYFFRLHALQEISRVDRAMNGRWLVR